jgi:hypothetical protein
MYYNNIIRNKKIMLWKGAVTMVFEREDFTEYSWGRILDQIKVKEEDRKGWICKIEFEAAGDYKITRPESRYSWEEVLDIVRKFYGNDVSLRYDSRQKGYVVSGRCSAYFLDDDGIEDLKERWDSRYPIYGAFYSKRGVRWVYEISRDKSVIQYRPDKNDKNKNIIAPKCTKELRRYIKSVHHMDVHDKIAE